MINNCKTLHETIVKDVIDVVSSVKDFDEIDACLFSETNWHLSEIDSLFNVTDWEEYTKCSSVKEAADAIWFDTYARKKKMARRFIS